LIVLFLLYKKTSILEFETGIVVFIVTFFLSLFEYKKNVISTLIEIESQEDQNSIIMKYCKNDKIIELKMNPEDMKVELKNLYALTGMKLKIYFKEEASFSFSDNLFWTKKQIKDIYEELNTILKVKQANR